MNFTRRAKGRTDTPTFTTKAIWPLWVFVLFWALTKVQSHAAMPLLPHPLPFPSPFSSFFLFSLFSSFLFVSRDSFE